MRKEILSMKWLCKPQRKKNSMTAKAVVKEFGGIKYLITDICLDRPYVRIVLTENSYENYFPEDWSFDRGFHCTVDFKKGVNKAQIGTLFGYRTFDKFDNLQIDEESKNLVSEFCKYSSSFKSWTPEFLRAIESIEAKIYKKQEDKKIARAMDKIHKDTDCIKKYPARFQRLVEKNMIVHYLFVSPFKGKKTTTAICSACGQKSEVTKILPKKCPVCGKKVTATKKHTISYPDKEFIFFQNINGNYYQRHFGARYTVKFDDNTGYENFGIYEKGCVVFNIAEKTLKTYFKKYDWFSRCEFWDDKNLYGMNPIRLLPGITMFDCDIKTDERFKYSGIEYVDEVDPLFYLQRYLKMPEIEMLAKVGLKKLAVSIKESDLVRGGKKPWEILGVDKVEFNRMRAMNASVSELHWFQFEHKRGITIDDDDIRFLSGITPERLDFIADKMSYKKIRNYLENQLEKAHYGIGELLGKWEDYIDMAKNFKKDLSLELNYKPKSIVIAHDELANIKMAEDRENEILEKFPEANEIISSLTKYEFSDGEYSIVAPKSIKDIIREGRILGHCLDRTDRYFDRITRHESFILFLRKTSDLDMPFYTLEVEPDGTTRQKRTYGDRQDADYKECVNFIKKWQRAIKSRLTSEDISFAEKSAILREQNFHDLRERKEKVWHGLFAGQLLVDILEADLVLAN